MDQELSQYTGALQQKAAGLLVPEMLLHLTETFPGAVTFSTSFSFEDQAIAHNILSNHLPVKILRSTQAASLLRAMLYGAPQTKDTIPAYKHTIPTTKRFSNW